MQVSSLILLLCATGGALASPIAPRESPPADPGAAPARCTLERKSPEYCAGTANNASLARLYLCGDIRLGPRKLPTKIPVDSMVETYDRLGGACPGKFIAQWWDEGSKGWRWPAQDGFSVDDQGRPIKGNMTLPKGLMLDRFGGEWGTFVSPAAAPYMQRALPPVNLVAPENDPKFPYNYHVYKVAKPFTVQAGPILPWFGQPGQGVQYQLSKRIYELIEAGFLESVDPEFLTPKHPHSGDSCKREKSWRQKSLKEIMFGTDL